MNTLQLNVSIPSLSALTPVGPNKYQFEARLFKPDGVTPVDNPNLPQSYVGVVDTVSTNFAFRIPIVDGTYSSPGTRIALFATNVENCCIARYSYDIFNTETVVVSPQALLFNNLQTGKIHRFEPSTQQSVELFTGLQSFDIAHTPTKLFLYDYTFVNSVFKTRLREHDITLDPFTESVATEYFFDADLGGAGLHAVSNTLLYMAGEKVIELSLNGGVVTPTVVFSFPAGYACTGDLIYDTSSQLFLITYHATNDYRVGIFRRNGTIVRSAPVSSETLYGMYQFGGNTYLTDQGGQIYTLNLSTLAMTPFFNTGISNAGASQIQSNISIPS